MLSDTSGKNPVALGGPDREVAVDGPFEPAADGPAVDRADHRLRSEHDRLGDLLDRADQGAGLGLARWLGVLFAVVSGAECPSGAGEDDGVVAGSSLASANARSVSSMS